MTFPELVDFLLVNDVQLAVSADRDGGSLQYDAPAGVLTDAVLDALREHKTELIAWLRAGPGSDGVLSRAPVSHNQQRLWDRHRAHPRPAVYNIRYDVTFTGRLEVPALAAALNGVVARHSALRTRFVPRGPVVVQEVMGPAPLPLPVVTRPEPADEPFDEPLGGPFELDRAPLLRARLVADGARPDRWTLQLVLHHLVCDHTSIAIMLGELAELYAAAVTGRAAELDASPPQYAGYARWQRGVLADPVRRARLLDHWRAELDGARLVPVLRHDRPRHGTLSGRGASREFTVPASELDALRALATRCGSTLQVVLLSAFATLLSRITGQDDVVVISSFGGRLRPQDERTVGIFTDALPLRARPGRATAFPDVVGEVGRALFAALDQQPMPLNLIVETLGPQVAPVPVPTVLFTVLSPEQAVSALPGVTVSVSSSTTGGTARMELYVIVQPGPDGLDGLVEYSTDLFDAATVDGYIAEFVSLLAGIASTAGDRLSRP